MYRLLFSLLLLSFQAFAQNQKYQLQGTLGEDRASKTKISFTLSWNEIDGKANGTYKDNFYADSAPMKGIVGELGRIFVVTFPKEVKGVRTISFLSSDMRGNKGSALIPVSVSLRDEKGTPVKTTAVEANLIGGETNVVAQRQEDQPCQDGFGDLAGYCGAYTGMLSEELDTRNKCNLLAFNNARLLLDENAEVGLVLGEPSEIIDTPVHRIGRLFRNPASMSVDLLSRSCRSLPGTNFSSDDCKRLGLTGTFNTVNKTRHFTGQYTITNERTNESCRYTISMDQEL